MYQTRWGKTDKSIKLSTRKHTVLIHACSRKENGPDVKGRPSYWHLLPHKQRVTQQKALNCLKMNSYNSGIVLERKRPSHVCYSWTGIRCFSKTQKGRFFLKTCVTARSLRLLYKKAMGNINLSQVGQGNQNGFFRFLPNITCRRTKGLCFAKIQVCANYKQEYEN